MSSDFCDGSSGFCDGSSDLVAFLRWLGGRKRSSPPKPLTRVAKPLENDYYIGGYIVGFSVLEAQNISVVVFFSVFMVQF